MSTTKWVQHISGQGEKWEYEWEGPIAWICKTTGQNGMVLPKSEYLPCDPPELWVDVTEECGWVDPGNGERGGISHYGLGNAVCTVYAGYRLRKNGCHFIVERKETS